MNIKAIKDFFVFASHKRLCKTFFHLNVKLLRPAYLTWFLFLHYLSMVRGSLSLSVISHHKHDAYYLFFIFLQKSPINMLRFV